MCHLGNPEEIYKGVKESKFIEELLQLLKETEEVKLLEAVLKCLYELMVVGSRLGSYNVVLDEVKKTIGVIDRLETLQYHQDELVFAALTKLL